MLLGQAHFAYSLYVPLAIDNQLNCAFLFDLSNTELDFYDLNGLASNVWYNFGKGNKTKLSSAS